VRVSKSEQKGTRKIGRGGITICKTKLSEKTPFFVLHKGGGCCRKKRMKAERIQSTIRMVFGAWTRINGGGRGENLVVLCCENRWISYTCRVGGEVGSRRETRERGPVGSRSNKRKRGDGYA